MSLKELATVHARFVLSGIRDARTFLNVGLIILVVLLCVSYAHATTPNPGHPWTDIGDGVFIFTNGQTTTPYTYTFPAANATALTTNSLVTVGQGGTGVYAFGGANTVLYTSAANTLASVTPSTANGQFLQTSTSGSAPTWATTLGVANGGTGLNSFTTNDLMYGAGTAAASLLAPGATTGAVLMNTAAGAPSWSLLSALPSTSGLLPIANGGTNSSATPTNGGVCYGTGSAYAITAASTAAGQFLQTTSAGSAPTWLTTLGVANGGTGLTTLTSGSVVVGAGASTPTFVAPSTAGNVLESTGSAWTSVAGGVLIGKQVFVTGNTTYTPTSGTNSILIRMVAGGGGGGGATGATTPTASVGGGGGSGSYAEKRFSGIAGASSYTIAVGAGGSAGAAANGTGGTGGNTTFACPSTCTGGAVTVTANGGIGGTTGAAATTVLASLGGSGGGVSTGGDVNSTGSPGEYAMRFSGSSGVSGSGAPSAFGSGGKGSNATAAGTTPVGYGGGGGGAASLGVATAEAGGAGAPGVLIIEEYR